MSAPRTSLRAAVVGAGLMGRWHAHAVRGAGSRVVVIVDSDRERAEALAARLPVRPAIVQDVGYALEQHRVDVLHVCTPVESHDAIARAAIASGVHVLVEKPLAADAATVERLHRLATEHGVLLAPVHQFLFQPGILEAQRWLARLGVIRQLDFVACSAGADRRSDDDREDVARDIIPHGLALARRLLGAAPSSMRWEVVPSESGEIRAMAHWGAASVAISISMRARPTENSLTVRCDQGTVRANLYHGFATVERGTASRLDKLGRPFIGAALVLGAAAGNLVRRSARRESAYPGLRELVTRFHRAIVEVGVSPITAQESIEVSHQRDAILEHRSAAFSTE